MFGKVSFSLPNFSIKADDLKQMNSLQHYFHYHHYNASDHNQGNFKLTEQEQQRYFNRIQHLYPKLASYDIDKLYKVQQLLIISPETAKLINVDEEVSDDQ